MDQSAGKICTIAMTIGQLNHDTSGPVSLKQGWSPHLAGSASPDIEDILAFYIC